MPLTSATFHISLRSRFLRKGKSETILQATILLEWYKRNVRRGMPITVAKIKIQFSLFFTLIVEHEGWRDALFIPTFPLLFCPLPMSTISTSFHIFTFRLTQFAWLCPAGTVCCAWECCEESESQPHLSVLSVFFSLCLIVTSLQSEKRDSMSERIRTRGFRYKNTSLCYAGCIVTLAGERECEEWRDGISFWICILNRPYIFFNILVIKWVALKNKNDVKNSHPIFSILVFIFAMLVVLIVAVVVILCILYPCCTISCCKKRKEGYVAYRPGKAQNVEEDFTEKLATTDDALH